MALRAAGVAAPTPRSSPGSGSSRRSSLAAARAHELLVCEGVGGLLVPITPGYLVRDLAIDLGLPLVVAARTGLGTINHTLLTVEAARTGGPQGGRRGDDARGRTSRRRWSARTARPSSGLPTCVSSGLPPTSLGRLAEAGAELPLEDWL